MEEKTSFIEPLFARAEEFGKTSIELLKLKAIDKSAGVVSTIVSRGTAVLFLTMFIVIVNIGAALWLGDILGKSYYGFFCVAGFYGIIGGIIYFFMHNTIKKRVSDSLIIQMLN